ncbi:sodium:solute symporter [Melioribacteraceae bacterium 4301-Me]|uniref:sodium:solute symporter family protein n=1 Tax=Pyranulibacter aquaticus TaxID=3163344 RepID=UPI00359B8C36
MVSFSILDASIIILFFLLVIVIGFIPEKVKVEDTDGYLLSGRKVGLLLFVLTNVSTWYGGILGVGEFTYRYGLLSWVTQGLPYYIFAVIFALTFAKKIRQASLFTIPDKLEETYGRKVGLFAAIIVAVLVSPAPYLLMVANLIALIFHIDLFFSLILAALLSMIYLFKSGYKSDLYTDAFEFFVMFLGFIVIVLFAINNLGGVEYLTKRLPAAHLSITGGASPEYLIVWFLIALWTFVDPGFHQRCYAAKNGDVAVKGIIISVFFWALFDFLTTTTGLFARAELPNLNDPVLSFPLFAEKILTSGWKGLFYSAMFATILSTLNSFMFLSATTFGRDFIYKLSVSRNQLKITTYTRWGLIFSSVISIIIALFFKSVIQIWYTIGSICIPSLVILIISSYYAKIKIHSAFALIEMVGGIFFSLIWFFVRSNFITNVFLRDIEPMIIGLVFVLIFHLSVLIFQRKKPFFGLRKL